MKLVGVVQLGWQVASAKRRNRWSRRQLAAHQRARLSALVRFARTHSPYYARTLPLRDDVPVSELPVLTKRELGDHWQELVTDRSLDLASLRSFLARPTAANKCYGGRYHVMSTSGTTGDAVVFCYDDREWVRVMTSAARLTAWRGVGPDRRTRIALVMLPGGSVPPPMGARIGATMRELFPLTTFIDASLPMPQIVAALEAARPELLSAYAGTLSALAEEKLAGRLHVTPRMLQSTSEVLAPAARARVTQAFGIAPHDTYAMTEAGMVAATCREQRGLHVQDDSVILEVLDERGQPAAPGTFGSRVLLTVLWSRTLPLIRYEITDRVCLAEAPCPCGLPFTLIEAIDGRAGDVLELPGSAGMVRITPSQVQRMLAAWPLASWQVHKHEDRLDIRVVPGASGFDAAACKTAVARALADAGVAGPRTEVIVVDRIEPLPSGKLPRFVL